MRTSTRHRAGGGSKPGPATFSAGAITVVSLANPREKFWGVVLNLSPEGLSMGGIELASFEDVTSMVKSGEPFSPAVVFFPMHRIERIELDCAEGRLPSLAERFQSRTGITAVKMLAICRAAASGPSAPRGLA